MKVQQQFEYRVLFVGGERDYKRVQDMINDCAADGWELVNVEGERAYLKRPLA
jgi:hypothetical protein